jgi:hypothetical protein
VAEESAMLPAADYRNCWFGTGNPPGWDTGAINSNPQFIDAVTNNFQLKAGSPCCDAGLNVSTVVKRDILGALRPQGSGFDLGAYEYVSATSVEPGEDQSALIHDFRLQQNYPNPFNSRTTIHYALPEHAEVTLQVLTLLGQPVKELVRNTQTAGFYNVSFDASNLASGVYFYRLEAHGKTNWSQTRKFVFLK